VGFVNLRVAASVKLLEGDRVAFGVVADPLISIVELSDFVVDRRGRIGTGRYCAETCT